MRFDLHLRSTVREQIEQLAETMKAWEENPRLDPDEQAHICERLGFFVHTTVRTDLCLAGVAGSGDFPALSYADAFVYVVVAQHVLYASDALTGLREIGPPSAPLISFTWIPEDEPTRNAALDQTFADLAGRPIPEVIEESDYRQIKAHASRRNSRVADLADNLIRPHAADAGNIGIQLRSTAELGTALRLIQHQDPSAYVLLDGTLSLPLVSKADVSLFYEHLKRLCCVEARRRGIGFFALSRSHGLPNIETIEEIARERAGLAQGVPAEHWYLRLPVPDIDEWELRLAQGRRLPPPGAVSYLVRFHRTTPTMRLDMDVEFWREHVRGKTAAETLANEQRIFGDLDYASHDQRCYGYPYPLKAGHDRAALTQTERSALRKQIIDTAVRAGLKRTLFRSAAHATGHR